MSQSVSDAEIRRAAHASGVPYSLLIALLGRESGNSQSATSPKGARGVAQLMPATAKYESRKHGLNTNTPYGNLLAGAYYLREQYNAFKSWRLALAAYNAGPNAVKHYNGVPPYKETRDYVKKIMDQAGSFTTSPATGAGTTGLDSSLGGEVAAPAPTLTKQDAALQGLSALAAGKYDPSMGLEALQQVEQQAAQMVTAPQGASTPDQSQQFQPAKGGWKKWVTLSGGADRAGVHTAASVLDFVGQIARLAHRRLTIGTGTNHSQMTVNGNVSDHWSGHAADIPATGALLIRLGRMALIAAGMPRREAMKQKGGLFNVPTRNGGRIQVIFNTYEGGNHTTHLHVGVR